MLNIAIYTYKKKIVINQITTFLIEHKCFELMTHQLNI